MNSTITFSRHVAAAAYSDTCLDESVTDLAACLQPCLVFHALYSTMATLYESVSYVSRERLTSSAASNLCLAFPRLTVSLCLALSLFLCPFVAQSLSSIITFIQLIALCAYLLLHIYPLGESQLS